MKNIAIIISSLSVGGGAQKIALRLAKELRNKSYNIHVLTFYNDKESYTYNGSQECLNQSLHQPLVGRIFGQVKGIRRFCSQNNIDTAIAFKTEANFSLILSGLFGKSWRVIVSERVYIAQRSLLANVAMRLFYPGAYKVVTCSKKMELHLRQKLGLKNTYTIYNPFDMGKSAELQQQPIPRKYSHIFQTGNFVFINIGRLDPQKGHTHLLHSFSQVIKNNPNAKLIIIGEGERREEIENLIVKFNLQKNVFLLGNQENVFSFLKASNCFVLSSLWEGFPNVLTEALSVNLPVISTDCETGPREILSPELSINETIKYPYMGTHGILISPNISESKNEELSNIMKKIMRDNSLQKAYSNGKNRLVEFQTENIINQWLEVV